MRRIPSNESLEDNTSYLMSVSDMMSGLLFIFIITLMAFVINFRVAQQNAQARQEEATSKQRELEGYVAAYTGVEDVRRKLLEDLRTTLERQGVKVSVDHEQGVLRLGEGAIRFESNRAELNQQYQSNADIVADALAEVLPCYTARLSVVPSPAQCDGATSATLEAIFVEGHTDNRPSLLANGEDNNWELSTNRAITTYREFIQHQPSLDVLMNKGEQKIFSVTGYGPSRPLPGRAYATPTDDAENRRIDLRFIMMPPDLNDPDVARAVRERIEQ